MFREDTFNFVFEKLLVDNDSEIQFHFTEIKLHLSEIILHKTEMHKTHFTISVQSSERNVPLVSGTNMIFDIKKTVAIILSAYD